MLKEPRSIKRTRQSNLKSGPSLGGVTPHLEVPPKRIIRPPLGGFPRECELRPNRQTGSRKSRPSPPCKTCPVHLEGEPWKDKLFFANGKPIVCNGISKWKGCGNKWARSHRINRFRAAVDRYLTDHPEEVCTIEEVKA